MAQKINRKPIGNFFIKKALQFRLILKIVMASLISTILSSGTLILVYFLKYKTVIVYQLDKISQELSREHIVYLILPTLLISSVVSILVSIGIGLYASRKYAVPVYKLEQWATLQQMGKLSALLRFREKEEMSELSTICNQLSSDMRERFAKIRTQSELLKQSSPSSPIAAEIEKILSGLDLETVPIEVSTAFITTSNSKQKK